MWVFYLCLILLGLGCYCDGIVHRFLMDFKKKKHIFKYASISSIYNFMSPKPISLLLLTSHCIIRPDTQLPQITIIASILVTSHSNCSSGMYDNQTDFILFSQSFRNIKSATKMQSTDCNSHHIPIKFHIKSKLKCEVNKKSHPKVVFAKLLSSDTTIATLYTEVKRRYKDVTIQEDVNKHWEEVSKWLKKQYCTFEKA